MDIYRHFASTLLYYHPTTDVPEDRVQKNISPEHIDTEILRALNWFDYRETGQVRIDMRVKFLDRRRVGWNTTSLAEAMKDDVVALEISDDAEPFWASWHAMTRYKDCLVSKELGEELFSLGDKHFRYVRSDYMLKPNVIRELTQLYQEISEFSLSKAEVG